MMEEKKLKHIRWFVAGLLLIALIAGSVYVVDSKNTGKFSVPSTDPETGIQEWIDAMNQRNIDRVYDLAPDEIKDQVTPEQFKMANINNTLLKPGNSFTSYTVIEKKQNGTSAQITAQVILHIASNQQNTHGTDVPVVDTFALLYQHGEWKVWMM
jgi:hypothetical protein